MQAYQRQFIEFILRQKALSFGDFTLKSGRCSPYFFNAGVFNTGAALAELGRYYAAAVMNSGLEYDTLFGPAYKGIPLVSATAIALATGHDQDRPYCFNRKVAKDHGEGGVIVGAPLQGRILLIDDVITAGTAIRDSMQLIAKAEASLAGVIIAMDRQERGQGAQSAIQEVEQQYRAKVVSIITLTDLFEYLQEHAQYRDLLPQFAAYRKKYGIEL